jgi:hypothetical protein
MSFLRELFELNIKKLLLKLLQGFSKKSSSFSVPQNFGAY